MRLGLSWVVCAVGTVAFAQTAIIPTAQLCSTPKIGSYTITGTSGTFSLIKFTCIDPPVTPPCSPLIARVETISPLSTNISLANSPAPNTVLIAYFTSSLVGFDKFIVVINPQQQISLNLPATLTPLDTLTLIYWSN